jgi:ribosomal protein S18 acetylase RimI-like enzyme
MRIRKARPAEARRQADWIVALPPWRGLGYRAPALGRWLARVAGRGWVKLAVEGQAVVAVMVVQPEFLLGRFIALLAVQPPAAGRGLGRALVTAAGRGPAAPRWLYTSSDGRNRAAAAFYRRLGFSPIGRLPGLIRPGRTEILWRRATGGA